MTGLPRPETHERGREEFGDLVEPIGGGHALGGEGVGRAHIQAHIAWSTRLTANSGTPRRRAHTFVGTRKVPAKKSGYATIARYSKAGAAKRKGAASAALSCPSEAAARVQP